MDAGRYDLHTHSYLSDGTTSPTEIAEEVARAGLTGFALTDHDTTEGWNEAREASARLGLDFIPGVEITTKRHGFSVHLLAYGIDPENGALLAELTRTQMSRLTRAETMVERLSADYDINWGEVSAVIEPGATLGRPHIADALVNKGHFADRGHAFQEVLHPASPYYVHTYAMDTADAVALVNEAGGVAVLAHPAALRQKRAVPLEEMTLMHAVGLWGVELDHPENSEDWLPELRLHAAKLGLEVTGSSDFHGAGKVNRIADRTTGLEVVERMRERVVTKR